MNFELLKDAYAVISGIPDRHFHLDTWVHPTQTTCTTNGCGTIACAGGWLAHHPYFQEQGLRIKWNRGSGRNQNIRVIAFGKGKDTLEGFDGLAKLFRITEPQARQLFAGSHASPFDHSIFTERGTNITHKELFKSRVRKFLKENDYSYNGPAV